jgi:hypothetical protein
MRPHARLVKTDGPGNWHVATRTEQPPVAAASRAEGRTARRYSCDAQWRRRYAARGGGGSSVMDELLGDGIAPEGVEANAARGAETRGHFEAKGVVQTAMDGQGPVPVSRAYQPTRARAFTAPPHHPVCRSFRQSPSPRSYLSRSPQCPPSRRPALRFQGQMRRGGPA